MLHSARHLEHLGNPCPPPPLLLGPHLPLARSPWLMQRSQGQCSHQPGTWAFCHHRPCRGLDRPLECAAGCVCALKGVGLPHLGQLPAHSKAGVLLKVPPRASVQSHTLATCRFGSEGPCRGLAHPARCQMARTGRE